MKDKYYESRFTFNPSRSIVWKEIVKFLKKYIPENGVIIDLGAGYCDFINNIKADKKYAVDISPELSKFANKDTIQINQPAWNLFEIKNDSVDVMHASNLFEHFTDEELGKVMKEINRVLKKDGKLILMQPNYRLSYKNYFDDPTHKKVFSDFALESFLLSYNFKILLKMSRFLPFSMRSNSSLIPNFLLPYVVRTYIYSPFKPFAGQMLFVGEKK
ncbi:MAG: methyltransferase domain-containing protein [Patescibacteria group bacterium]